MSEKRYVISELDPISVLDMNTGDTFPIADGSGFVETIVECLNALHEENQELKRLIKATVEDYTDLKQSFDLIDKENEELKLQVQKIHNLINSKIQSARELGSVKTVVALKNLQRELNGDV